MLQGCDAGGPVFAQEGGSRVTFEVDLEGGYESGLVNRAESPPEQLMAEIAEIMRYRLGARGLDESKIEFDGQNRITLELAGPLSGGIRKDGSWLTSIEELVRSPLLKMLSMPGKLEFLIAAMDALPEGTDWVKESTKLDILSRAYPDLPLAEFNRWSPENNGPHAGLRWAPWCAKTEAQAKLKESDPKRAVLTIPQPAEWTFTTNDLYRVFASEDRVGFAAVGFEFKDSRKDNFKAFTGHFKNHPMAITIDGQIDTMPTIGDPLPGAGIIQGRYTDEEMRELLVVLRAGELPIGVSLVAHEYVAPPESPAEGE